MQDAARVMTEQLVANGRLMFVRPDSGEIPEGERDAIRRGFAGHFGSQGLACTLLRDDGAVLLITPGDVDAGILRHELIHVAQCFADPSAQEAALARASEIGAEIVAAIGRAAEAEAEPEKANRAHRDFYKSMVAWRNCHQTAFMEPAALFGMYQSYYPTPETAELGAAMGLSAKEGVYAAMTAYMAGLAGIAIDPLDRLGREIVAYTFQEAEDRVIDALFLSAAGLRLEEAAQPARALN